MQPKLLCYYCYRIQKYPLLDLLPVNASHQFTRSSYECAQLVRSIIMNLPPSNAKGQLYDMTLIPGCLDLFYGYVKKCEGVTIKFYTLC